MKITTVYSHLNGLEFIKVHKPHLWEEVVSILSSVDSDACRTKHSKEKTKQGRVLYSPIALNHRMAEGFHQHGWQESRTSYWVTEDAELIRATMDLPPKDQKLQIEAAGKKPIFSYNQTDFVKDRIAVEVQFGKYAFVAFDLFVKHMAFYMGNLIDVGVEILPMKALQAEMSSGVGYYEGELYNLIRQGRGVPAVPLVMIGVES